MPVKHTAAAMFVLLFALLTTGCTSTPPASTTGGGQPATTTTSGDTASAQLGAQIFTTGKGADGAPIEASAGTAGPCARCHGADAKGAAGPDIRWAVLTGTASSSRAPRFTLADEAAFATAITTGNAAGNQLGPMMPRFQLTPEQISGLAAYLKTL